MNKKEKHNAIFENLKRLAASLVKTMGRNCEVAIHDFSKLPHSLVHIEGIITRRETGAPITDLVIKNLRRDGNEIKDMINYKSLTREGRTLKSSTTFIRNCEGDVVGAYCVNYDITDHLNALTMLNDFTQASDTEENHGNETFATSLNETIGSLLNQGIAEAGKQPATMNRHEKVKLVESLEFKGAFLLRGAVDHVAKSLGVSKYSIYNYLKEVRTSTLT